MSSSSGKKIGEGIANLATGGLYGMGKKLIGADEKPGEVQQGAKIEAVKQGTDAADQYWKRTEEANNELKSSMDSIFGESGSYTKSISDYKNSINNALSNYNQGMNEAINKYSGENATKEINNLASEQAAKNASKAGAESVGAMRSAGMSKAGAAALANSNTINAYNQGLGQQQQLASNQYSNALNASMNKYAAALQNNMTGAQSALDAQGNRANQQLQGNSVAASNRIGAAGQDVANWQNQAGTAQGAQNVMEKVGADVGAFTMPGFGNYI